MKMIVVVALAALTGCVTAPQPYHPASFFLDPHDRDQANEVLEGGSEDLPASWDSNGVHYTVIPTRTYKDHDLDCREYTAIRGSQKIKASACRRDDGTWHPL